MESYDSIHVNNAWTRHDQTDEIERSTPCAETKMTMVPDSHSSLLLHARACYMHLYNLIQLVSLCDNIWFR